MAFSIRNSYIYIFVAILMGTISSIYPYNLYAGGILILIIILFGAIYNLKFAVIITAIALSLGKIDIYKNLNLIDISIIILFLSYLRNNQFKLSLSGWPVKTTYFLILFTTIPLIRAIDPLESIFNVLQIYLLLFSTFVFFQVFKNKEIFLVFIKSWILSSILFITLYIIPFITNSSYLNLYSNFLSSRASYTFGDPNYFASYLVTLFPFMFLGLLSEKFNKMKMISFFGLSIILIAIILTYSRASWLTLMIVFFLLTWSFIRWHKKGLLLIVGVAAFFLISMYSLGIMEYSLERFSALFDSDTNDGSIRERRLILLTILNVIKDNFLFGVGLDMFPRVFSNYQTMYFRSIADTHNTFLTIWSELGTFGFLSFISLLYFSLIRGTVTYIKSNYLYFIVCLSVIAYLITACFINNFYSRTFWCLIGILLATKNNVFSETQYVSNKQLINKGLNDN